ncbi:hypothetical protein TIFTF001_026558 [Ficus carica]|uniref:Uncharacterized protein n=1 Tax=Ficus carica TaxID=3494 RepID=A0AA88DLQ1_FICCA|nr:hypothetical protein TIFTF001_026558 [Ficus carica]
MLGSYFLETTVSIGDRTDENQRSRLVNSQKGYYPAPSLYSICSRRLEQISPWEIGGGGVGDEVGLGAPDPTTAGALAVWVVAMVGAQARGGWWWLGREAGTAGFAAAPRHAMVWFRGGLLVRLGLLCSLRRREAMGVGGSLQRGRGWLVGGGTLAVDGRGKKLNRTEKL